MLSKKRILILVDYFIPGFMAGGPIQSIQNLCLFLKDEFDISIITRDTDLGSEISYKNIQSDEWNFNETLNCKIYYCSKKKQGYSFIRKLIANESFDYLYLNSLYSPSFTITALRLLYTNQINGKVILAPRGELNPGAMQIKFLKKRVFIFLLNFTGLPNKIIWNATNKIEKELIKQFLGNNSTTKILSNIPKQFQSDWIPLEKEEGQTKFVFLSRISQMKNLEFLLETLLEIKTSINLDIYGPLEDKRYWQNCQKIIAKLPTNVEVNYKGQIPASEVSSVLAMYHFFILPTLGENFGHAIFESLLQGKPILISQNTPWINLAEKKIGWDLSLDKIEEWRSILSSCCEMSFAEYKEWSQNSWQFACDYKNSTTLKKQALNLFS